MPKLITNTDALISDKLLRMQISNIRKAKHLTQKQVAELSGLSETTISNIESGSDSSPTLRSVMRLCNALDIELYVK